MDRSGFRALCGALLAVLLLPPASAHAQAHKLHSTGFWTSLAVGVSSPNDAGISLGASLRYRSFLVRIRAATSTELFGNSADDIGVLIGTAIPISPGRSYLALAAGVGSAGSSTGGFLDGSTSAPREIAYLLDIEARLALLSFAGVTANFFADRNSRQSFAGFAIGIYLGRL